MRAALRDEIRSELHRIGEDLLHHGERDGRGMSWPSVTGAGDAESRRPPVADVWSGNAGVALFLLELYGHSGDERYLDAAAEGVRWAEERCLESDSPDLQLYTGAMGVALVLLRLADRTGDRADLQRARRLVEHGEATLDQSSPHCDLLSGVAGTLLGLLHLHAATGDGHLLRLIDRCAQRLLDSAHHGRSGLYWDRSPRYISGLCGVAHGAGGIGFALLELARQLDRPGCHEIAEQAFIYEDQFFDPVRDTWADLRRGYTRGPKGEGRLERVRRGDYDDLVRPPPSIPVWCRGGAGIGMIRLHAYTLLHHPSHLRMARRALAHSRRYTDEFRGEDGRSVSFSLCHGLAGPGELFIEAGLHLNEPGSFSSATAIAELALQQKRVVGCYVPGIPGKRVERSLFLGDAGVGYFFLRLLNPRRTPSVLIPRVGSWWTRAPEPARRIHVCGQAAGESPGMACVRKLYPRMIEVIAELAPDALEPLADPSGAEGAVGGARSRFEGIVRAAMESATPAAAARLGDLFGLELARVELDLAIPSHSLLDAKRMVATRRAIAMLEQGDAAVWTEARCCLSEEAHIIATRWSWRGDGPGRWRENTDRPPGAVHVLLLQTPERLIEWDLTRFEHLVLSCFDSPKPIAVAMTQVEAEIEANAGSEHRSLILGQIREAMRAGILVDAALFGRADGNAGERAPPIGRWPRGVA